MGFYSKKFENQKETIMRKFLNGMFCFIVLASVLCALPGTAVAARAKYEKSNELYAKAAVDKLNELWGRYVSLQMSSGKKPASPRTFNSACKRLLREQLIAAVPSARAIEGWQLTFTRGDSPSASKFGYKKADGPSDDVSPTVAESSCKMAVANLNSAWQQYLSLELVNSNTPACPDDYEEACDILEDKELITEIPNPRQYPKWEIRFIKGKTAQECKFEATKARKKSTRKYTRKKSPEALLKQSREGYCSNLNSAWQQYVAAETAANNAVPPVPADYAAACKILADKEYIKSVPPQEVDGWRIEFVKDKFAQGCKFQVVEPKKNTPKP
ncbi:MAG: hypothetical protein PHT84_04185 [Candidatus Pacebacteria bacterium]|nr:hypothetical protein [Candidatus Paceibacterota bacterium]